MAYTVDSVGLLDIEVGITPIFRNPRLLSNPRVQSFAWNLSLLVIQTSNHSSSVTFRKEFLPTYWASSMKMTSKQPSNPASSSGKSVTTPDGFPTGLTSKLVPESACQPHSLGLHLTMIYVDRPFLSAAVVVDALWRKKCLQVCPSLADFDIDSTVSLPVHWIAVVFLLSQELRLEYVDLIIIRFQDSHSWIATHPRAQMLVYLEFHTMLHCHVFAQKYGLCTRSYTKCLFHSARSFTCSQQ